MIEKRQTVQERIDWGVPGPPEDRGSPWGQSSQPLRPEPVDHGYVPHAQAGQQDTRPWYAKKRYLIPIGLTIAFLALGALSGGEAGRDVDSNSVATMPALVDDALPEPTTGETTTCDAAREALLTGDGSEVATALSALQADPTADAIAREYADYYLHRDADNADLQSMDVTLIRTACS